MRLQLIFSHAFALCYFHIGLQFVQIDGVNDMSSHGVAFVKVIVSQ